MEYNYAGIETARAIRVLRVRGASNRESSIHCDLIDRSLDKQEPRYEALSYCWGGQEPSQTIFCSGQRLQITLNCKSALRYFRPTTSTSTRDLWIDAICINQSDEQEKNHQVRLMGDIYEGASRVLVWLENESAAAEKPEFLSGELHVKNFAWLVRLAEATASADAHNKVTRLLQVAKELDESSEINATSMNELLARLPWFKRLWIIQEVVLSKKSTMVYGGHEASLDALIEARHICLDLVRRGNPNLGPALSVLWNLFGVHLLGRKLLHSSRTDKSSFNQALEDFITEVRFSKATNERDKIIGLYGLFKASGIMVPEPQYSKPAATVYREAMVALMEATGCLNLIKQVDGLGSLPDRTSWVPDWSSSKHSIGPGAGCAAANSEPAFRFLGGSSMLGLIGFKVDTVVKRSSFAYMHISERIGDPAGYACWTRNPPIVDRNMAQQLEQQPHHSTAILLVWNIRVLRDFVTTTLGQSPATATRQSVLSLYRSLLSLRGEHQDAQELGFQDTELCEHHARDFFGVLLGQPDEEEGRSPDEGWILGRDFEVKALLHQPALCELLHSKEYDVLRCISRSPVRKRIFDCISRMRYLTVFTTESGRTGIAPWSIEVDDELVLCSGFGLPIVTRPVGSNYRLVCCAHVDGIMDGEAWEAQPVQDLSEFVFI